MISFAGDKPKPINKQRFRRTFQEPLKQGLEAIIRAISLRCLNGILMGVQVCFKGFSRVFDYQKYPYHFVNISAKKAWIFIKFLALVHKIIMNHQQNSVHTHAHKRSKARIFSHAFTPCGSLSVHKLQENEQKDICPRLYSAF